MALASRIIQFLPFREQEDPSGFRLVAREEIARGGTALIHRRIYSNGHREIEKILHPRFQGKRKYEALQTRESTILSDLRHPGLIRCLRLESQPSILGSTTNVLIFEDRDSVALDALIPYIESLDLRQREIFCGELYSALAEILEFLQARNVVHGDISPENILVDSFGFVRLIDFACATREGVENHEFQVRGKTQFRAPEFSDSGATSLEGDVFAVGKILELCLGPDLGLSDEWSRLLKALLEERKLIVSSNRSSLRISVLPDREFFAPRGRRIVKTLLTENSERMGPRTLAKSVLSVLGLFVFSSWMPQTGQMTLNSWPKAQVVVDALGPKIVFETPITNISLPAGKHRVRFVSSRKDIGTLERDVMVLPGETVKIFEDFSKN